MISRLLKLANALPSVVPSKTGNNSDVVRAWSRVISDWRALEPIKTLMESNDEATQFRALALDLETAAHGVSVQESLRRVQIMDEAKRQSDRLVAPIRIQNNKRDLAKLQKLRTKLKGEESDLNDELSHLEIKLTMLEAADQKSEILEADPVAQTKKINERIAAIKTRLADLQRNFDRMVITEASYKDNSVGYVSADEMYPAIEAEVSALGLSRDELITYYEKFAALEKALEKTTSPDDTWTAQRAFIAQIKAACFSELEKMIKAQIEESIQKEIGSLDENAIPDYVAAKFQALLKAAVALKKPEIEKITTARLESEERNKKPNEPKRSPAEFDAELARRKQYALSQFEAQNVKREFDKDIEQLKQIYIENLMKAESCSSEDAEESWTKQYNAAKTAGSSLQQQTEAALRLVQVTNTQMALLRYSRIRAEREIEILKNQEDPIIDNLQAQIKKGVPSLVVSKLVRIEKSDDVKQRTVVLQSPAQYKELCDASTQYKNRLAKKVLKEASKDRDVREAYWTVPKPGQGFVEEKPLPTNAETFIADIDKNKTLRAAVENNHKLKGAVEKYKAKSDINHALTDQTKSLPTRYRDCHDKLIQHKATLKPRRDSKKDVFWKVVATVFGAPVLGVLCPVYGAYWLVNKLWFSEGEKNTAKIEKVLPAPLKKSRSVGQLVPQRTEGIRRKSI